MAVTWHTAPDGRRFKVFQSNACLCAPCWQAWCECGVALTKHDFDAEGARRGAVEVLASNDARPGFGHPRCRKSRTTDSVAERASEAPNGRSTA